MYLLFVYDRDYESDSGHKCNLQEHLRDLKKWGNTPDFWDDAKSLVEAFQKASNMNCRLALVNESTYDVVEILNESE